MKRGRLFGSTRSGIEASIRWLTRIAFGALLILVLLIVVNVLGRFLFRKPLPGTVELIELVAVVVIFFAVAYTEFCRGHVTVELLTTRFPRRTQNILASIMVFFTAVYFAILAWRGGELAWEYISPNFRATFVLMVPHAPFIFAIALGSLVLALETLVHVFQPLPPEEEAKKEVGE